MSLPLRPHAVLATALYCPDVEAARQFYTGVLEGEPSEPEGSGRANPSSPQILSVAEAPAT